MNYALSELDILTQKIEHCFVACQGLQDENNELKERLTLVDNELLAKDKKIEALTKELEKKDSELQELVEKLDKILD